MAKPAVFLLCLLPLFGGAFEYREAQPGYRYQFPRDHFAHQDFRTEWWYYTGNVTTKAGERFGFELVFFRQGERRKNSEPHKDDGRHKSGANSAWDVQDLYVAHAALTDVTHKGFRYEERVNRAGPGVAGADLERRRIWNGNWSSQWQGDNQTLDAITEHFRLHLQLVPEKPVVIEGENGVSQKAEGAGRASYYLSFPLLGATGTINGIAVSGTAWMDHEWFTEQLAPEEVGWDWFSVQLDNRTELMLFDLRRKDRSIDPHSSGTFIDSNGEATHLRHDEFTLQPLSYWHKYPIAWRIHIPSRNIDVTCRAVLPDQELRGDQSYWEGAVDYSGTQKGVGYLEMTGYESPIRF